MKSNTSDDGTDSQTGPMWSKFFTSLGPESADGDNHVEEDGSAISGSAVPESTMDTPPLGRGGNQPATPFSEVHPNDSASALGLRDGAGSMAASIPVDDGTYIFKFVSPAGLTHRFQGHLLAILTNAC